MQSTKSECEKRAKALNQSDYDTYDQYRKEYEYIWNEDKVSYRRGRYNKVAKAPKMIKHEQFSID